MKHFKGSSNSFLAWVTPEIFVGVDFREQNLSVVPRKSKANSLSTGAQHIRQGHDKCSQTSSLKEIMMRCNLEFIQNQINKHQRNHESIPTNKSWTKHRTGAHSRATNQGPDEGRRQDQNSCWQTENLWQLPNKSNQRYFSPAIRSSTWPQVATCEPIHASESCGKVVKGMLQTILKCKKCTPEECVGYEI